jgi:hypothetical protein
LQDSLIIASATWDHEAVAESPVVGYSHGIKGEGIYVYAAPHNTEIIMGKFFLTEDEAIFVIIDIQERLANVMGKRQKVI